MADSNVIREFLVALGYKNDEPALRKFEQGIARATKTVFSLAAAVEATAVTIAVGVAKFSSNLEQLYFASMKVGSSATNLKAIDRAARDFGLGAGEALASMQGLARFLRNNPAGEGILQSWFGVNVTDPVTGQKRDMKDVLVDIGKAMQAMPQWRAQQLGGQIGLSEDTIRWLQSGTAAEHIEEIRKELEKADFDGASARAHKFMEELRKLGDQLQIFGTQIEDALQAKLGISIKTITDLLREHGPEWAKRIAAFAGEMLDDFNAILKWVALHWPEISQILRNAFDQIESSYRILKPALEWLYEKFVALDASTDGWSTKLLVLFGVLKLMGATSIISGVMGLAGAFVRLGAGITGMVAAGIAAPAAAGGAAAAASGALVSVGGLLGALVPGAALGVASGALLDSLAPNNWLAQLGSWGAGKIHDMGDWIGKFNDPKHTQAVQTLREAGLTREAAEGIVANLQRESGLNAMQSHMDTDGKEHYGTAQWSPERQEEFAKWAGHTMQATTDPVEARNEQLRFIAHQMLARDSSDAGVNEAGRLMRGNHDEQAAALAFGRHYERYAGGEQEDLRRQQMAAQLHQTITIQVTGSSNPEETARLTAAHIKRIEFAAMREFAPGVN